MFSLSGKSKNQIPCFPCAVATLWVETNSVTSWERSAPSTAPVVCSYPRRKASSLPDYWLSLRHANNPRTTKPLCTSGCGSSTARASDVEVLLLACTVTCHNSIFLRKCGFNVKLLLDNHLHVKVRT